jgi:ribosomal protein S18 acetylase RimI-like enzyme
MTDLVFRPLAEGETDLFTSMSDAETTRTGTAWLGRDFAATMKAGHYRPQWTWVALDEHGTVKARAAWYGGPDDDEPFAMDWFDPGDDPSIGAELLKHASLRKDYPLILPPAWRDDPATRHAASKRIAAAEAAGMTRFVERLHLTWTPDRGVPEKSTRLTFRAPESIEHVREVLQAILEGTLDAYSRRDVEQKGAAHAAQEALDVLTWLPGKRDGWRLAYNTNGAGDGAGDGDLVGIVVPSRNYTHAVIAFVGVMPGHRGHGYAFDLLAEGTLRLVHDEETEIHADTDVTNAPMAATFARAGYLVTQRRLILTYE